ncbi:MAG: hypothetical protein MZV70_38920 [Desulfobacterales bacterium]|nr:hypothetical protein [Desulfobacterales bacterium]
MELLVQKEVACLKAASPWPQTSLWQWGPRCLFPGPARCCRHGKALPACAHRRWQAGSFLHQWGPMPWCRPR